MPYRVEVTRAAERQLDALPDRDASRVVGRLLDLADDPRPRGALKLSGTAAPMWRIRTGEIRVIYSISDRSQVVLVERIARRGHRPYERLP
ncbi:MAG: type II toxin-antitoxin system RelE/ParE family toxin [Chloroflexi bacterium]|nr:type II toxin-antitoxin system RelE/ParE family toxin [Chloroflexota bacterium]